MALAAMWLAGRGGFTYVNLDSLLRDPIRFLVLLALPSSVAVVCLVAALLPRLILTNVAILVSLIGLLELGAWLLAPAEPLIRGEPEALGASAFYVPDKSLGYVMAPSVRARHRRWVGNRQIYDVLYQTDAWGRRETPTRAGSKRTSYMLFFGDSNMFGEGLSQDETLPYYAGEVARSYRPYNYGVSGYGPSHLLVLARRGGVRQEVAEGEGYAVYYLIPAHLGRVIGSSNVSTSWGRHFPYVVTNGGGELVAKGNFVGGRPYTTLGYFLWSKSNLAHYFQATLPLWYTKSDYRLTARVLKESSRLLGRQLQLRRFVVVIGQVYNDRQRRVARKLREALLGEKVPYLDYTELFNTQDVNYRLAEDDYHNSALANRTIANRLILDLRGAAAR